MEEKNSNVNSPDNGNNGQYDNQYTDPGNMQFTNPENMQFTNPENMQYTDPENIQFTNPENMQQGYVPYNYAQGPEVPEPKRNNKKLGIIIGSVIGAVVVIAIICAVLLPKLLISDKAKVCQALAGVGTDMVSGNPASVFSNIGAAEMFAKFKAESMEGRLSLELDEFTGTTYGDFASMSPEGFQFDLDLSSDMKEKQMTGSLTLGYLDMELFTAGIFADEESFSFGIPVLFDGYLRLPSENIMSAYNNSVFGKNDPVDESMDFSLNMFADIEDNEDMIQIGAKLGSDAIVLYNNMSVEKMNSERQFNLDGKTQTAKKYVMIIKHDDYYNLVNHYLDGIMGSEKLMASAGLNAQTVRFYKDGFNRMFNGDIQVDVYLVGDKVACIEAATKLDSPYEGASEDRVDALVSVSFADSTAYNQAYEGKITLDNDGDSINVTLNKDTIIDGDKTSSEFGLYFDVDDSFLDYTYAASYDKRGGGYSYAIDFMIDNEAFYMGMNGSVNDIKEGTSFDVTIDDLFLEAEGDRIGFSGSLAAGPLDGAVKKPDVDFRDLFSMTEDEYMDFVTEVQENLYGVLFQ